MRQRIIDDRHRHRRDRGSKMSEEKIKAQLRGLAWMLAGIIGAVGAMEFLRNVAAEIDKERW